MNPFVLPPNQLHRFYRGGVAIKELRGGGPDDDHAPEDWVGSATTVFGEQRAGLSPLPDGRLFPELLATDAEAVLGPEHVAAYGTDPALLTKLLDAGERLPVHVHPDRAFARRHLGCVHGKTEAWVVVGTRGADPVVHLGFHADVDDTALAGWVDRQDTAALLGALHQFPVTAGDAVLVPAGTPHAIGEGVFIVELQEPTDLSVLLEWEGYPIDGRADGHLGLGFDVALRCVDRAGVHRERLDALRSGRDDGARAGVRPLLPPEADPFFRAEGVRPRRTAELDQGFAILVVVGGAGELRTAAGASLPLQRGQTVLIPHAAGAASVTGDLEAVRCRPPAADHGGQTG